MKSAKKNWLSRLFKSFSNSSKKSGYKPQPLRIEHLEERAMLNVAPVMTLDSTTYDITSNSPWYIPLTSTDADGDAVYYKVEVLSGNLTCDLSVGTAWKTGMSTAQKQAYFNTRNPYWELTIAQEGNSILNGEDSTMLFELFADKAPNTVEHILTLTDTDIDFGQGHTEKFYQNSIFHRVIEGFMSQGGGYDAYGNFRGSLADNVADEFNNDLQMNSSGVLAMANTGYKDTGSSQFFVTSDRCNWLNFKHSVFGFLIDGQEVQAEVNKQGTNANSTPDPKVIITNAEQVVNYTNSTLTVRANTASNVAAGTVSTGTIRVTPYDQNGKAGTSQVITLNVTAENQVPVFYPIENDYAYVVQGNDYTQTYAAGFATGEQIGYYSELYYIKYDEEGKGTFEVIPNAVSTNYDTGEVTVNCSDFSMGDYYLGVYALKYNSAHLINSNNILASLNVPIVIGPESVPAPTSVSLALSDDTGVIGDGYTSVISGITFTVEGADSRYETETYAGQYYLGSGIAEEGSTTVDVVSQQYNSTTQTYSPLYFGYGSFDIVAVNTWYCPYWNGSGWSWASKHSDTTSVFELHTVLDTPENPTATGVTATEFNLSWSAVDNADSYYIEFRKKGADEWIGGLWKDAESPTSCSMNSLDPSSVYEVRVYAYLQGNDASLSLPSEVIEVQTLGKLSAPANLWADFDGSQISASWDAVDNAAAYSVYYRELGTEQWNVGAENIAALTCQFNLAEGEDASLYEVAVMAVSGSSDCESSDAAIVLTNTGDMPLLTAALTTWNGRSESVIPLSVNEWEFLNLQLFANPDDVVNQGGISIVFQYDATLVKPDWTNSEFANLAYSYHDVPLDEYGTTREVTFIAAILDSTTVSDGLVANIKMVPANPADFSGQAGVAVSDESRDLTITVFTDKDKTASEANVINTSVWAVPYDLDDSGAVDVQDFVTFATYYGYVPDPTVKDAKYYCDFNKSGTIETNDFVLFATYYGRSYAKNGAGIAIAAQTNADAVNAQGAAAEEPITSPAQSEESRQTVVTTTLVEPIHDCILTPASSSNEIASVFYFADVIQASSASNTLINQNTQATDSVAADNAVNTYSEQNFASDSGEINALTADSVDLFFDLELFNDDENSDWEGELGEEILPTLLNRNSFTD
ncbi:MAG: peptidylprolyl isomerase [Thermoguttaceae bacterium]|nr:peptidylprolyl isomerase [Thermoguttaceae bacterium]